MEPRPPTDRPGRTPGTDPGQRTAPTPVAPDARRGAARPDAAHRDPDPMATRPMDAPAAPRFAAAPKAGSRTVRAGHLPGDDPDPYDNRNPSPFSQVPAGARGRGRRRRGVATALGTLVLLGALAVGAVLWNQSRDDDGGNDGGTRTAATGGDAGRATEQAEAAAFRAMLATGTAAAAAPTAPPTATVPPPTATLPAPTTAPEPTPPPTTAPEGGADAAGAGGAASDGTIASLLPTEDEVPTGLVLGTEGERTEDEVVFAIGDTAESAAAVSSWGWEANVFRTFQVPEGETAAPGAIGFMDVSIHRCASPDGASEALMDLFDVVLAEEGWQEVEVEDLGDQSRALLKETDGGRNVVFYIRSGSLTIRVGGFSADGDPTEDLVAVTETILAK